MAAEKSIEQKVKDIIVEQLGVNPDQVTPDAKFIEDLGADSLDTVELVMALDLYYRYGIYYAYSGSYVALAANPNNIYWPHLDGGNIAYADGHVKWNKRGNANYNRPNWNPAS